MQIILVTAYTVDRVKEVTTISKAKHRDVYSESGGVTELCVCAAKAQMIPHCNDPVPWMLPSEYRIIYINGGCDN